MIDKSEVESLMQITARQMILARSNAVLQERDRLRGALKAEIHDHLDPEWNHAIKRALELLDSDARVMHPVMSASEVKALAEKVMAKIDRLIPNHAL